MSPSVPFFTSRPAKYFLNENPNMYIHFGGLIDHGEVSGGFGYFRDCSVKTATPASGTLSPASRRATLLQDSVCAPVISSYYLCYLFLSPL